MEVIVKIDRRSKQAKAFYEYMKTLPFVKVEDVSEKPDLNTAQDEIMNISKEVNKSGTKKWFEKLGIEHNSHSG
jgi:hypothetical protein